MKLLVLFILWNMLHVMAEYSTSDALERRQQHKMVKISTDGEGIPLLRNWAQTWCSMPDTFAQRFNEIYDFVVKSDDVFVVTFPKCGTTWIQEATWLLLNGLDYVTAGEKDLAQRSVYLEISSINNSKQKDTIQLAADLSSPRIIKSHLPVQLLPRQIWMYKNKIIYCARNPKDVVVSYGHFLRGMGAYSGTMQDFIDDFLQDSTTYTPFWPHILHMWQMRHEPNIFFTTYEEMQRDLRRVVDRLNAFLEKESLDEDQMKQLIEHLSFSKMRVNKRVNPTEFIKKANVYAGVAEDFEFMRRGIVGSYKDELSVENQRRLDEWTAKNLEDCNVTVEEIFGVV